VINGTYVNYDKVDGAGVSECPVLFQWGFDLVPTSVAEFAAGVDYQETYDPGEDFDGGTITYTVTFTMDDGLGFSGTLDAVGSGFSGIDSGCNGDFPTMELNGGKSN
jgi:hypothetical protein